MSLTKLQVQAKYPEVYESYTLQASLPEAKYVEKIKFWEASNINCFERWTIPYFLEREKEKKRPCLRLNYPPDGKCNECTRGTCRYDKVCFMCGLEGHGAFQSFPGGKLKGELKCTKHRNFLSQLGMIRLQHGIDEDGLRALFKLPGYSSNGGAGAAVAATVVKKVSGATAAPAPAAGVAATATAAVPPATKEPVAEAVATAAPDSQPAAPVSGVKAEPAPVPAPAPAPVAPVTAVASTPARGLPSPKAQQASPPQVPAPVGSPVASSAVGGNMKAPGSWSLPVDNAHQQGLNLGLNMNSMLSGGSNGLSYEGMTGSGLLGGGAEDSGRRLWAGPAGGAHSAGDASNSSLLPPSMMPHAPPVGGAPLGLNSKLFGAGGLLPGFDAMTVNNSHAPPQQSSFGSTLPPMMLAGMGSLPGMPGSLPVPPPMQFQSYELIDGDEFAAPATLRVALNNLTKDEANGSYISKGALITIRGVDDVMVRCFRKTGAIIDSAALRNEIKTLRMLSRKCPHVTKIVHQGTIELSSNVSAPAGTAISDLIGIVSETSELGTLDRFTAAHMQSASASAVPGVPPPPAGFSTADLQSMCVQLIEGLVQCHEVNVRHRDIRPQNILVTHCHDKYQSRQFSRGLMLKFANFTPLALVPLCTAPESALQVIEQEKWCAPEVDAETRKNGVRFTAASDVWSLGLTIYYLATGGQLPFDSHKQACDAAANPDYRRVCLEKHGLQERAPMLYDLIERLVRPAYMRTDLQIIRCHPFLWTMECRKSMLTAFANASMTRGSEVISNFVTGIDKISPLYVFGAEGWVAPMAPYLLALVQPAKLKTDFWWSGTYLLQAIKNQLQFPEILQQAVYPRLTVHQATYSYLRQITEVDFPRLLILLYELGGIHGKWLWDGDEIMHTWN